MDSDGNPQNFEEQIDDLIDACMLVGEMKVAWPDSKTYWANVDRARRLRDAVLVEVEQMARQRVAELEAEVERLKAEAMLLEKAVEEIDRLRATYGAWYAGTGERE